MHNHPGLIAFGTFGSPNGFRQTFFGKTQFSGVKAFDLNTNALMLFPATHIYAMRKEQTSRSGAVSYAIYSYAKEPNSDRNGAFVGVALMFPQPSSEQNVVSVLNQLQSSLVARNLKNGVIQVRDSKEFSILLPSNFESISNSESGVWEDIEFTETQKHLVIWTHITPEYLPSLLQKVRPLLNEYDTIYFTDSADIADFVRQRGIYRAVDITGVEVLLQQVQVKKAKQTESYLQYLHKAEQDLRQEKKAYLAHIESEIARGKQQHAANEQKLQQVQQEYSKILSEHAKHLSDIQEIANYLKRSGKVGEAQRMFAQINKKYGGKTSPEFAVNIPDISAATENATSAEAASASIPTNFHRRKNRGKTLIFKWMAILFASLWLLTLAYLIVVLNRPIVEPARIVTTEQKDSATIQNNDSDTIYDIYDQSQDTLQRPSY